VAPGTAGGAAMTSPGRRFCDSPHYCCEHVRRWGGDQQDQRRYLCARDDDGSGRHCWEIRPDPETGRLMARPGCGGRGSRTARAPDAI